MQEYLFRGRRPDTKQWVEGHIAKDRYIIPTGSRGEFSCHPSDPSGFCEGMLSLQAILVDPETVSIQTGLKDRYGVQIFVGDIVELMMPHGGTRRFVVGEKTVIRKVISHPDFDDPTAKVAITGIVFSWQGYDLFPCMEDDGSTDVSKMAIIGNIWDTPAW